MGPSLAHRGIEVERRCDESLCASVDSARLRQAILNLVTNAADAMPQGGRLLIVAAADVVRSMNTIAVEDSGPGVPEAIRAGLQETPASTKPFGLGLGLAVCRDVAAAHGGELHIERSAELGGARFVVTLPLAAAAAARGRRSLRSWPGSSSPMTNVRSATRSHCCSLRRDTRRSSPRPARRPCAWCGNPSLTWSSSTCACPAWMDSPC